MKPKIQHPAHCGFFDKFFIYPPFYNEFEPPRRQLAASKNLYMPAAAKLSRVFLENEPKNLGPALQIGKNFRSAASLALFHPFCACGIPSFSAFHSAEQAQPSQIGHRPAFLPLSPGIMRRIMRCRHWKSPPSAFRIFALQLWLGGCAPSPPMFSFQKTGRGMEACKSLSCL